MEPNKPVEVPANKPVEVPEGNETYTPTQLIILKIMRWGAWTAVFSAILLAMH